MAKARTFTHGNISILAPIGLGLVMAACSGNENISTMPGTAGSNTGVGGLTESNAGASSLSEGGSNGTGGAAMVATGGSQVQNATGGTRAQNATGGSQAQNATGGADPTGGALSTGGNKASTGGSRATGGQSSVATGGLIGMATGGNKANPTGGFAATGGRATGGAKATGGAVSATGGAAVGTTGGASCTATATGGPPAMNHGQACMNCHSGSNPSAGISMTLAGTIYSAASSSTPVVGATVKVTGSNGTTITMVTGSNGDFYSTSAITFPATVVASKCPNTQPMTATITNGNCNSCHSSGSRIHLP